jgi:hypothetical protein
MKIVAAMAAKRTQMPNVARAASKKRISVLLR